MNKITQHSLAAPTRPAEARRRRKPWRRRAEITTEIRDGHSAVQAVTHPAIHRLTDEQAGQWSDAATIAVTE